jgi:hypothetical protein
MEKYTREIPAPRPPTWLKFDSLIHSLLSQESTAYPQINPDILVASRSYGITSTTPPPVPLYGNPMPTLPFSIDDWMDYCPPELLLPSLAFPFDPTEV